MLNPVRFSIIDVHWSVSSEVRTQCCGDARAEELGGEILGVRGAIKCTSSVYSIVLPYTNPQNYIHEACHCIT